MPSLVEMTFTQRSFLRIEPAVPGDFEMTSMYLSNFAFSSPLFLITWIPFTKIGWSSVYCYYLPYGKGVAKRGIMPCAQFDWNWPCGSGGEHKIVKKLKTSRTCYKKLTWAFSTGKLYDNEISFCHKGLFLLLYAYTEISTTNYSILRFLFDFSMNFYTHYFYSK